MSLPWSAYLHFRCLWMLLAAHPGPLYRDEAWLTLFNDISLFFHLDVLSCCRKVCCQYYAAWKKQNLHSKIHLRHFWRLFEKSLRNMALHDKTFDRGLPYQKVFLNLINHTKWKAKKWLKVIFTVVIFDKMLPEFYVQFFMLFHYSQ